MIPFFLAAPVLAPIVETIVVNITIAAGTYAAKKAIDKVLD